MTGKESTHEYHGVNTPLDWIRIVMSLGLMTFSVVIVFALIIQEDTRISRDIHPAAAACIMWACIIWMTMVEGGQASMVGLPPVDRDLYKESHPITYKIAGWGLSGDNLNRYLLGRQFMVIFINFTISLCGAPLPGSTVFGLPPIITKIFLESGIAMVLQNVIIGQLTSQINASHCMLDYINNHFMTFTLWVTFAIEATGVVHLSYFIQYIAFWAARKPIITNEPPRGTVQNIFHWGRILFSAFVLCYSLAVTLDALFLGQTTMAAWGIPPGASIVIFVALMCLVGILEGMQIAFFAVAQIPKAERGDSRFALLTCESLFKNGGKNLPGFMVGRQMTVTLCFFVIARVTTIDVQIGVDPNIFGVSDTMQQLFNTGLLGAIITTILASISWQLVAGAFPIAFLSNPIVYVVLQFALALEATGICAATWFLAMIQKKVMRFKFDEYYIGTPEERAAKEHADDEHARDNVTLGTYALAPDVGTHDIQTKYLSLGQLHTDYSVRRELCLKNIKAIREQISVSETDDEREAFQHALKLEIKSLVRINKDQVESSKSFETNLDHVVEETESDEENQSSAIDEETHSPA